MVLPPRQALATEVACPEPPPAESLRALGGLRELAAPLGLRIGSVLDTTPGAYRETALREFSAATPKNAMKWALVHPARDTYDFCAADAIVALARDHGMRVRGHTLAWHEQNPPWLLQGTFTRDGLIAILRDHIQAVVGHYREKFPGVVYQWDVVNEPIADCSADPNDPRYAAYDAKAGACALRRNLWLSGIGPDYVALALQFAREADPQARLFVNEYGTERGMPEALAKRRGLLNLVTALKAARAPLDGVGLQFHLGRGGPPPQVLATLMNDVAASGVEVAVTELDVAMGATGPGWIATPADLELQAQQYRQVLDACLGSPAGHTFVMWGFTDAVTWIAPEQPCIFDRDYRPKPAYRALRQGLLQAR